MVARLRAQIKDSEEELYAMHHRMKLIQREKEEKERERQEVERQEREKEREREGEEAGNSEIIPATNTNLFKDTLRDIRKYLDGLGDRKAEVRQKLMQTSY